MTSKLTNEKKRHLQIKYLLGLRGRSLADISRDMGHNRADVASQVSRGETVSNRVRQRIADECGMGYEELWGEWPRLAYRPIGSKTKNRNTRRTT